MSVNVMQVGLFRLKEIAKMV